MRASNRNKNFLINTLINFITRFGVIGINLLLVPLLLLVVGKERFGIWQTLLAIISWSSLLNFGLGNGLRNHITKLITEKKQDEIGNAIGSTLKVVSLITFAGTIIILPSIFFFLNPDKLFAGNQIPSKEVINAFIVFAGFFLININLGLSNSIAFGFQKSSIAGITNLAYLVLSYMSILIFNQIGQPTLVELALIFGGAQSLVLITSFVWQLNKFRIKLNIFGNYPMGSVYKLSGHFFAVQLLGIVYLSIDNFIISIELGAEQTAEFAIPAKYFMQ